jgi:hypothetical protein
MAPPVTLRGVGGPCDVGRLVTLEQLAQLGRELVAHRMPRHAAKLRELYRVTRDGQGTCEWSIEHAARLASILGLEPNPMGVLVRGATCPNCSQDRPRNIAWQVTTQLEHCFVQKCTRCGCERVVLLNPAREVRR